MKAKFLVLPFLVLASSAIAQAADVKKCHNVSSDNARLKCYDEKTEYRKSESSELKAETDGALESLAPPSQSGSQWRLSSEKSALDSRKDVWLSLISENTEGNSIGAPVRATLWVRCMENKTNFLIGFERYTTDDQNVRFKLDDGPVRKQWMETMRGGDGIGIWSGARAIPFIKSMFGKDRLVISYQTYTGPVEFSFNVSGLGDRIEPLSEACQWKP